MREEAIATGRTKSKALQTRGSNIYTYIVDQAVADKDVRKDVLGFIRNQNPDIDNISAEEAPYLLQQSVNKLGDRGLHKLGLIHPDKELIINAYIKEKGLLDEKEPAEATGKEKDQYNNCCLASGKCYNNADNKDSEGKIKMANTLIIAGVGLAFVSIMGLIVISSIKK